MKNSVSETSFQFAKEIIFLCRTLKEKHEFVLSNQILKSGTSIGANVREAQGAESKRDFVHKMAISLKEANESKYWLDLLVDTEMIDQTVHDELAKQLLLITNQLAKIIITTKKRYHLN